MKRNYTSIIFSNGLIWKISLLLVLLGSVNFVSHGQTVAEGKVSAAVFYKQCNYSILEYEVSLGPGSYTTADLYSKGIPDNDISSLRVSPGYIVILYGEDNFQGNGYTFKSDDICLIDNGLNEWTSSIVIKPVTSGN